MHAQTSTTKNSKYFAWYVNMQARIVHPVVTRNIANHGLHNAVLCYCSILKSLKQCFNFFVVAEGCSSGPYEKVSPVVIMEPISDITMGESACLPAELRHAYTAFTEITNITL
jgi:hypothetical protein